MPRIQTHAIAAATLVSVALAGCSLTKPPLIADPSPVSAHLLAEQRTATQKGVAPAVRPQPQRTNAAATLDVARINRKLEGEVGNPRPAPTLCSESRGAPHIDAHATWGDTLQDQQRRKACASSGDSR